MIQKDIGRNNDNHDYEDNHDTDSPGDKTEDSDDNNNIGIVKGNDDQEDDIAVSSPDLWLTHEDKVGMEPDRTDDHISVFLGGP